MVNRLRKKLWLLPPLFFFISVGLSSQLTPSSVGMGTHRSLGLPPCLFQQLTHLPCPSCGLTTSWTYLAHLEWIKAFLVHPFGPPLFLIVGVISLLAIPESLGKKTALHQILAGKHHFWIYLGVTLFLVIWLIRVFLIFKNRFFAI